MKAEEIVALGNRLRRLRLQSGVGLRELGRLAEMSPAALSAIEKGTSSPTLATLHKILKALNSDFALFFAPENSEPHCPVFPADKMREITDAHRRYKMLFPRRDDARFNMMHETITGQETQGEWETHDCDVGGVVQSGGTASLEIDGQGSWPLTKGDAFYIKAGMRHRLSNQSDKPLQLITVMDPPRY